MLMRLEAEDPFLQLKYAQYEMLYDVPTLACFTRAKAG